MDRRRSESTKIQGRKQSLTQGLALQESIKEKQQRYKEEREERSPRISAPIKWLIVGAADYFNIDAQKITDFILDSEDQVALIESFISKKGNRTVMFMRQEGECPKMESGRIFPSSSKKENGLCDKVLVTDGKSTRLQAEGQIYYYARVKPDVAITTRNVAEETVSGVLDPSKFGGSILLALEDSLRNVFLPALRQYENWGKLKGSREGQTQIIKFRAKLENNVNYLASADRHTKNVIYLKAGPDADILETIKDANAQKEMATKPEKVKIIEDLVRDEWCQQLNQVLAESDQMRKEADDTGPMAELDHWRGLSARFNFILEQIRSDRIKRCLYVLGFAKSKIVKKFIDYEGKVTDVANEAKDNVKFLTELEEVCIPLYYTDPDLMRDCIPSLVSVVTNIHNISRYFNTSQKLTSLYVKVTNQMVNSCKQYITDNGLNRIWDQTPEKVIEKIGKVKQLSKTYKSNFVENQSKINAECSEMYIFGKLDQFCKRLDKIKMLIDTIQEYSILQTSKIEGIEVISAKFQTLVSNTKKKPYDILETRNVKKEFEKDFDVFQDQLRGINDQILGFMDDSIDKVKTSTGTMDLMQRFKNLNLNFMEDVIRQKYMVVIERYHKELDRIQKHYENSHKMPPYPNNYPDLAGKICWSRQLIEMIQKSDRINDECEEMGLKLRDFTEGRKVIKQRNKLIMVLLEYELIQKRKWGESIEEVKQGIQATLLVSQNEKLFVNWDPKISEIASSVSIMKRLDIEVTDVAEQVFKKINYYKKVRQRLEDIVVNYDTLRLTVPQIFLDVMQCHITRVKNEIRQGTLLVTWQSLNHDFFFNNVDSALGRLQLIMKKVIDLKEARIDKDLKSISEEFIIDLPEEAVTLETFVEAHNGIADEAGHRLNKISEKIRIAVIELLKYFAQEADMMDNLTDSNVSEETEAFKLLLDDIFNHFRERLRESLCKCIKFNLEILKKRVFYRGQKSSERSEYGTAPLFLANINLQIPNVVCVPNLDEIQSSLSNVCQEIVGCSRYVQRWNKPEWAILKTPKTSNISIFAEDQTEPEDVLVDQPTYFKAINDNKDLLKLVQMVGSAVNAVREPISTCTQKYNHFKELWMEDREQMVVTFKETQPLLTDWKQKIQYYDNLSESIEELTTSSNIGAFILDASNCKESLLVETRSWKVELCRNLNSEYKSKMEEMFTFFDEQQRALSRNVEDLDDVKLVMTSLESIRHKFLDIDNNLGPIEECYNMLNRFEIQIDQEESNMVDSLRYAWKKLQSKEKSVQEHLIEVQGPYHEDLVNKIEQFQKDTDHFEDDYNTQGPMAPGITPQEASDRLAIYQTKFDDLWRKFNTYNAGETLFGLKNNDYPMVQAVKKELGLLQKLYGLYNAVMNSINGYYDILWTDVDIEAINNEILEFQNKCRKLPKALKEWQAYIDLQNKIDDFSECCPILELMTNKAMMRRHWDRIENCTKHKFEVENENFQLRNIMEAPILEHKEDLEDICISAVKEKDIEAKLAIVVNDWSGNELYFSNFKSRGELLLKGQETSDTIALMEDSLMVLSSLMSNRYNAPFKKDIQSWVQKLSNTTDIIEQWLIVQNLWVYLEAVFVGGDIAKQLPQEAKRFANIDKNWVKIMARAREIPNVVKCCVGDETMAQILPHLLEQLESCQKSLTGYLEQKRLVFPRFFFISDPALLEILGQASDSHTIQSHLLGIFENVAEVTFHDKEYNKIMAYSSKEGETVMLDNPVNAQGNVELWLGDLLRNQQGSLHSVIRAANGTVLDPAGFDLMQFLSDQPAQVGLIGIQMLWTYYAEEALKNCRSDKKAMANAKKRFDDILNALIDYCTTELSKFDRIKFETLVVIHVHQKDIFDELIAANIRTPLEFDWLKQARFYFDHDKDQTIVSITDVNFIYQNEFIGCCDRLCVTPLTDRCYITLAQALGMSMGGAPAGPAGTGKTETTKDMARCLGKYCVVFNCSDQMDFRGLGRIYKGLAQSGSWGCFDEFNRIDLPVLSVAAQQIYIVLQARKEKKTNFIFTDGDDVSLNPEFGLFITMNPGYAGRQELPENLKVQFRSVAMMVPDRQIIKRVKLASCGFRENELLAAKFFTLYKLCEQQLTKQVHYDFGLRNILSVLRTLGTVKRARPGDPESFIVMRVLRDMNLSKLVDEDEPLFMSLIDDLFPGIVLEIVTYDDLNTAMEKIIDQMGMINYPPWRLKVVQLYETQNVRHGMMALGPSGAGKTICIRTLLKCMTEMGRPHKEVRMNPKAITAPQMFGRLDVATNDWTDGIFSTLWRRSHKTKKGDYMWLILDGPVDAVWIENLNSVLDDNKTLTLANGDRIPMAPNCKILFEVHNIDNASPATVSRNGMVFMSASVMGWRPLVDGWLLTRKVVERDPINKFVSNMIYDLYLYSIQSLNPKMILLECNYIKQFCNLMDGLLASEDQDPQSENHINKLVVMALMWSIGAVLELDERLKLQIWMFNKNSTLDDSEKLQFPSLGNDETIFEYLVDESGNWKHWNTRVETYEYPLEGPAPFYADILIPNVDNIRTNFLIDTISKQEKGVLLIGEQGTGKTVMIKGFLNKLNPEDHMSKAFNFSSATEPGMFQRTIESYVDKRMGSTYGPPAGRKMTIFIDDINMPVINEWGDQITNEIVRQMMETNGMYSLEKPGDFTTIVDIQFIAAMIHPGGGRNDIPERLKRQYSVFNCSLPSNQSIDKIFGTVSRWFSVERNFSQEIVDLVPKLVPASRVLWQWTKIKMLPTPAKFHYIFNLRDLSRVWEGMLHIQPSECPDRETVLDLWTHEMQRVIADRFTTAEDLVWFDEHLAKCVKENVDPDLAESMNLMPLFVDFMRDAPEPTGEEDEDADLDAPKIYERVEGLNLLKEKLEGYLEMYNESIRGTGMDIVFFKDAIMHLLKVSRVIRTPRGAAMLVGVGGSGKQSMTKLASYIAGYKVFQIQLSRTYNLTNFGEDLKYLYKEAGEKGNGMSFILTDMDIKEEGFLEYLNNVLSSGEVSGLFAKDEIDEITGNLIPVMKSEFPRVPPTAENLYNYFIARARSNLHIVLCFSPVSAQFRARALKFPGIFSGCTMDWYMKWPQEALIAVSGHFLHKFPMICTEEIKKNVVDIMGQIHHTVGATCNEYFERYRRRTHVTPKSYLSFLAGFLAIYKEKHEHLANLEDRMNTGLDKLLEAGESVATLSEELVVKEKELAIASAEADIVLAEVTVSSEAAQKVKTAVLEVKNRAQALVDEINADKAVAEGKLAAAKPALEAAEAALNTIKAADISTVRKLAKPPHLIMRIMDCVLILFQKKVDPVICDPDRPVNKPSWAEALKLMSQSNFLSGLQQFNKDTITEECVELLEDNYFSHEDYTFENAKKVCGNVAGLAGWTKAMVSFYSVNKEVLPLKANLAKQAVKLEVAQTELAEAQAELDAKQAELDIVQAKFDKAMSEKQTLLDDADSCRRRMTAATALIDGLGGEKVRWTAQSKMFAEQIRKLVGDVILATGFLSYCGPFNQEFRNYLLKECWESEMKSIGIPYTDGLDLIEMLTDSVQIGAWQLEGLPTDDLSIQNAIIVTKASRYPLLIDPQGQAKTWIKKREGSNHLQVTTLNNKYFRTHLEDSLSLGNPLLIEDVAEELDPALDNVLEKNFIKSGSTFKVKVGDKECDVMNGFRLYITTKLPNPKYTPEISARTSIIDFTVTSKGLEDQLLGRVILAEKQELEAERVKLMEEVTNNKKKMKELEDNLLYKLTSTKGSLVDDESLIIMLANTKETAAEVSEQLAVADETNIKINQAREEFRPVAERGSILYFVICDMSMVNCMYQISLSQFLEIFDMSLAKSTKSPITQKRITNIIDFASVAVFKYTCRGLYENDKLLFTLLMTLKIDLRKGAVKQPEFQCLIKGGAALDLKSCPPKPAKWILDMTWLNLVQLQKLPEFREILNQISRNEKQWKQWFDSDAPEEEQIPDGYSASLDTFRKLLLVRSWCPDRTMPQARRYIADSMGPVYAEAVILDLDTMLAESTIRVPMICLLSMGSDPTNQICDFAKKQKLECRCISMGQGQEVHARRLISMSMQNGGWVMLQNCHLGLDFMDELLETMQTADAKTTNESFRVWITTEPHPLFSITMLQSSIKFTNEPPQGVKAGLKRTFSGYSQETLDLNALNFWKPLIYAVAFLHTTVQERRKFGPLGWNIPYEFNSSDQTATVQFIQNHLDDLDAKRGIQWQCLRYMIGEVQYGGRVTDDFDKRLLNTFSKCWFGPEMFDDKFCFFKGYPIAKYKTTTEIMDSIEGMSLVDSPEVYGLHPNADITFQTNTAKEILDMIVNIQPKDGGGGSGETRESVVYRQCDEMLEKMPVDYVPHEVRARIKKMGSQKSLNIFLKQEIDRMQKVITLVRMTLNDLKLAIDGTIIMSEDLTDALDNIFDARVPNKWRKISWASSTLGFWFTELLERDIQFKSWIFTERPSVFWMTGFFNPQGFLTAMRQEVTRSHKGWALDAVILHNEMTAKYREEITGPPSEGVYVQGLYLDGAAWDRKSMRLIESSPKVLFVPLPVVHVYAINSSTVKPESLTKGMYQCPVYKKPCRTDLTFITCLWLKSGDSPADFWCMRGVALLCDIK